MHKRTFLAAANLLAVVFIIIVIGNIVIVAQNAVTGTWKADVRGDKDGKIHLQFSRSSSKHKNNFGTSFEFSELAGLTKEQAQNGSVNFRIVREAGTVECEGSFTDGKGSGSFRFVPDAGYLSAMRARGFDLEKAALHHDDDDNRVESKQFAAAILNVTTSLADDLRTADLGPLDVEDLFKAAIFKVDSKFMAEMKASGFPGLKMEDLVKARIFKIDADYVRQVGEMGFANKDFDHLVKFRIFKVTPEFLSELRSHGFTGLSSEEVVKFRIFNIDADFIRKAKAEDPSITVEEMVQMKIGVRRMRGI